MDQEGSHASPGQNRSSSLSDIGDRADDIMADSEQALSTVESDPNDTEAETERMEDSPQKSRTNQNLVLTTVNSTYNAVQNPPLHIQSVEPEAAEEEIRQASKNVASSKASSVENDQTAATPSRSKKRKRSHVEYQYLDDQRLTGRSTSSTALRPDYLASSRGCSPLPTSQSEHWNNHVESNHVEEPGSDKDAQDIEAKAGVKKIRGKRKARKASDENTKSPPTLRIHRGSEPQPTGEGPNENLDAAEIEDSGECATSDNINKDEESSLRKKSAMDSLNVIEKCFASLRDKLFDERLAKLDAELAMLAETNVTHPELLAMNQVLEQRRDEKIQHENTLLKYKLGSLQIKSKAEKAQVHGQYMQSVRDIRDENMEQVNKECHQIHKERRNRENGVPEYMYQLPTRRSQQITHQAAYNKEVSLLSGMAKYHGFPAAPEICGAKPGEIESDLEKMGARIPFERFSFSIATLTFDADRRRTALCASCEASAFSESQPLCVCGAPTLEKYDG
ncbi:MAG: hypothetical protein Q9224_000469 [Gallowayella concinna]